MVICLGRKLNKQRVTVLLATNANGTNKLPPYFIGKAKSPRCFAGRLASHYGLSYSANAKAWIRSDLFTAWLRSQDDIFRKQGRHVLLLMDNAPSHKTDGLKLSNIKVHKLEPNTTPFNQPLDAGIIHAFKARFRQMIDNHVVNVVGPSTADSHKVDILTGMQWDTAAWRDVTQEAILNCWKHFRVLPAPGLHEVEEQDLEYTFHMESDRDKNSLCLMLDAIHICNAMALSFLLM
uniref:PREDICTED: similar to tigger transposable element derived 4 putative n=1 Tax=Albugo laibachii Nc14 TaxID=890382 RepID=F0W7P1_9STRA|nr:PREDICTED: similar to tigger transposable element derived 4 putative [Albugo laibachii Nc14]|eukprot:CCA17142.1 PREDICTED: similar to tigger transposable element derived 4 putative [Albugo laibachii Nc14]